MRTRVGWFVVAVLFAVPATGQEFSAPSPAAETSVAALLERGLPPVPSGLAAIALATRWHGLAELQTRSLAAGFGWRSARMAAGVSQTGEADLGWTAAVVGVGASGEPGGIALRGAARRRPATGTSDALGGEVGAGAWVAASASVRVWASAPQLWTRGDSPPLERWLEIGSRVDLVEAHLWLARAAAPGAPRGLRAEHLAGIAVPFGPAALWMEARDHPPRGALGLALSAGIVRVAAAVESHPVLGETMRAALSWGEAAWW